MPALLLLFTAFLRELWGLVQKPKFHSLLLWVAILLAIGTTFYHRIEGWSVLDSLYFCVVTMATVGYGDLTPTTELGKAFAVVYILLGLGVIATFANMLATERIDMMEERRQARADRSSADGS